MIKEVTIPKRITLRFEKELQKYYLTDTYLLGIQLIQEKGWRGKREADRLDEKEEEIFYNFINSNTKVDYRCKKNMTSEEKAILKQLYKEKGYTPDYLKEMAALHGYAYERLLYTSKMLFDE